MRSARGTGPVWTWFVSLLEKGEAGKLGLNIPQRRTIFNLSHFPFRIAAFPYRPNKQCRQGVGRSGLIAAAVLVASGVGV